MKLINTLKEKVAIAGDVIWWAEGMDMEKLIKSRKKLLDLADYKIPGHGKMFKVKK